ncbi:MULTISPECIES: exodeoxyribonuclease VII small subunit [Sphingobacterium]|uniref:Exodeoxyribonuclease 7 small subunit n=1 Tax=Sphingobacterium cellulitidis TaxID=1768011 RepID=A0A8H9FX96_9SPHI|nr:MULTISPECIES: exodeoxyribonuclease VII small subunit [Sphingobacterium]MBA8985348.1 exodeoxyribonuclease VII small subunit [Sphingobacterium soli]OYD41538.1 exodeoxyribonuclease VII small subunit [Sphingobacterium cellulitidis]WFB63770.1 exodeoxyribonuclease VII small subunit [Sphingobacterium sp. WM]GGE10369.1 exodeoxyribonuclease 7 small subunit [Sphingobacterium soli]
MTNKYTYKDAFEELQAIVSDIESGDIAVDELTAKINRASELLSICKAKLTASEAEVEKLLQKLENENSINPDQND